MATNPTMSERTPLLAPSAPGQPSFGSTETTSAAEEGASPAPPPPAGAHKRVHFLNLVNTCFLLSMAFAYTASTLYVEIR